MSHYTMYNVHAMFCKCACTAPMLGHPLIGTTGSAKARTPATSKTPATARTKATEGTLKTGEHHNENITN